MKTAKLFFKTLALSLITVNVMAGSGDQIKANPAKSKLEWKATKVTGGHNGDIQFKSGSVMIENGKLTGGNFVFDMKTINTLDLQGEYKDKLDGHLKSEDFFHVEKFNTASFEIKSASHTSGKKYTVTGDLTIKGITQSITFDIEFESDGKGFSTTGTATVDRTKFDIKYGSDSFFDDLGDKAIHNDFTLTFNVKG